MENETLNKPKKSLFSINKTNISPDKKDNFDSLKNIDTKSDQNLILSKIRLKTKDNDLNDKQEYKKEKDYMSLKSIKIKDNNTNDSLDNSLDDEEILHILNGKKYLEDKNNDDLISDTKKKPFKFLNINTFKKSKTLKFFDFSKNGVPNSRMSLQKKLKNLNSINSIEQKEEKKDDDNKIFSTEINLDKINSNNSNENINIDNNNSNKYFQFRKNHSKKNLSTYSSRQSKKKKYEDPLLIPKEDMIFEEMKKYKCFQYFTQEELEKTGVPFIYIKMNMNPNKTTINKINQEIFYDKSLKDHKFLQKLVKSGKDRVYLSKPYNRDMDEERKKEILDNIYRIKTAPDLNKKIELNKAKKYKRKLKNYQNNFLKLVKHNITNKFYESLKDKFGEIREEAEGKYNTNFKFLKEIEKNEENIVNNINEICSNYRRFFATKNINKLFVKSIGPRLKLPKLEFIQIAKKEFIFEDGKTNKIKKKNLKKYLNKTNIKFNKEELNSSQNKDIFFSSTNYNKFNNLKSKSLKKFNFK